MTGIYMITNVVTRKRYIGLSVDITQRWRDHRTPRSLARRHVLARAMRKHGIQNFEITVLEQCTGEQLSAREIFWIAKLKPEYNMNEGGLGNKGHCVSDEVKARLSQCAKAQWERKSEEEKQLQIKRNLCGPKYGHVVSEEARKKLSLALSGRHLPESWKRNIGNSNKIAMLGNFNGNIPVACLNPNGTVRMYYASVRFGAADLGVSPHGISNVLNGRQHTSGGLRWVRAEVHA